MLVLLNPLVGIVQQGFDESVASATASVRFGRSAAIVSSPGALQGFFLCLLSPTCRADLDLLTQQVGVMAASYSPVASKRQAGSRLQVDSARRMLIAA